MTDWWRGAVLYQIYPRSFADSNGDGVGDLPGITAHLDYVASLGVDGIWISPFFKSPMADFGYDVSDYRTVDPLFGTNDDFARLLDRAHALGLKVIIDMVLSHTSDRHPWFEESRSARDNEKADWYVWADAKPDGTPPNHWQACFGGAWEWEPRRGQYYLHNFLASQPDLDLKRPAVQDAVLAECRYWLDFGVDGFRLDVANFYTCDAELRDNPPLPSDVRVRGRRASPYNRQQHIFDKNRPETLPILKRLRALTDAYPDRYMVGEIADDGWDRLCADYTADATLLHSAYGLPVLLAPAPAALRGLVERFEAHGCGWPAYAFSNHDAPRVATRWGGEAADPAFAKQMLALLCALRGTIFLYQGEELGLPEAEVPFDRLQDPFGRAFWPSFKGRDGARTPMPWDNSAAHAAFSTADPWLPIDPRHLALNVAAQHSDPDSTLAFARSFIRWRRAHPALLRGDIAFRDSAAGVLAFERSAAEERLLILMNLGIEDADIPLPPGAEVLAGHGLPFAIEADQVRLPRFGAAILALKPEG